MRYDSCTEYWLDVDKQKLRGEFENMYQDIADPWGCLAKSKSLHNKVFLELIFDANASYSNILDFGCGLGGFTKCLAERNGSLSVIGCDISNTAIEKARSLHPELSFFARNIMQDCINDLGAPFDLIVLSEILWYILDKIDDVFNRLADALTRDGAIVIKQYFPDNQNFGKEIINGLIGFENFIATKINLKLTNKIVCYAENDGQVLLAKIVRHCR